MAVAIARCPKHGLHGQRTTCFDCGRPVDQVPMVALPDSGPTIINGAAILTALLAYSRRVEDAPHTDDQQIHREVEAHGLSGEGVKTIVDHVVTSIRAGDYPSQWASYFSAGLLEGMMIAIDALTAAQHAGTDRLVP